MKLSNQELLELKAYKSDPDFDDVRMKETIKERLLENNTILYLLNNKELEDAEAEADEYFGINILPYYLIKPTQTEVNNFVCYEVGFDETNDAKNFKYGRIIFTVICEHKNLIEKTIYSPRHDIIASLLIKEFNNKNYFGFKSNLISDEPSVLDDDYACRTLIFELTTYNSPM